MTAEEILKHNAECEAKKVPTRIELECGAIRVVSENEIRLYNHRGVYRPYTREETAELVSTLVNLYPTHELVSLRTNYASMIDVATKLRDEHAAMSERVLKLQAEKDKAMQELAELRERITELECDKGTLKMGSKEVEKDPDPYAAWPVVDGPES